MRSAAPAALLRSISESKRYRRFLAALARWSAPLFRPAAGAKSTSSEWLITAAPYGIKHVIRPSVLAGYAVVFADDPKKERPRPPVSDQEEVPLEEDESLLEAFGKPLHAAGISRCAIVGDSPDIIRKHHAKWSPEYQQPHGRSD